jgi:ribose transport system ATP-binding protein
MSFVSIVNVEKRFGPTVALGGVSMDLERGAVHGLLGENGAGKSTLMKVLSGFVRPDRGSLSVNGAEVAFGDPDAARSAGLAMAFQELSSPPNVTVGQKLCLPSLPRAWSGLVSERATVARAAAQLNDWDLADIDPRTRISDLSLAQRQQVEIVSALSSSPKLLILDEPTGALSDPEWLFRQIRRVTATGTAVIYITHKLAEIKEICDHGTVLRNGRVVGSFDRGDVHPDELIRLMIGRSLSQAFPTKSALQRDREVMLSVDNLAVAPALRDATLAVGRGEIVGISALEGQGQRELFYSLAGLLPIAAGSVTWHGDANTTSSKGSRASLVPEERKSEGLFMDMTTAFNLSVASAGSLAKFGLVSMAKERDYARQSASKVNIKKELLDLPISALSGGNQQKVVFARAILADPDCLLLFDPTRGVDAATKVEIYYMARAFADQGKAVLVYSTEIPELTGLCDRVYSMYAGRINQEHIGPDIDEEAIMASALGHSKAAA